MVEQSDCSVWSSYFENWDIILKVLFCPDCVTPLVPGLLVSLNNIERVSRTFLCKDHLKRLKLLRQREKWFCVSDYFFIFYRLYQNCINSSSIKSGYFFLIVVCQYDLARFFFLCDVANFLNCSRICTFNSLHAGYFS